ncbi:hypothetical protein NM208_g5187 [Fusarium decemcellulare]|uniref:Uncharacterized protein n=1 Tax=Fusarium decemcellulare TaxID=57161 RepID=A0ACC1SHY5_9HYPO|nr:hypothetical protein NM208_g5187 [Fusarium decemcellulare]
MFGALWAVSGAVPCCLESTKAPFLEAFRFTTKQQWGASPAISSACVMVLLGLNFAGVGQPWSSTVVYLIVFGVVLKIFAVIEWKHAKNPAMPLRIFSKRSNLGALLVVLGATTTLSGMYVLPYVITFSIVAGLTGGFINHASRLFEPILVAVCIMTAGISHFVNLGATTSW